MKDLISRQELQNRLLKKKAMVHSAPAVSQSDYVNEALIAMAIRTATAWRGSPEHNQAAEIIDMLVAEI